MRLLTKNLSVLALLIIAPVVHATTVPPAVKNPSLDSGNIDNEPLDGIVLNRTITVLGWDFYRNFVAIWRARFPNSKFTVSVFERPTAQFGSEIWIQYKERRMFHTFLSPARSATKPAAAAAVQMTYKNIVDSNVRNLLFSDVDLAPEEM